jgi:hypothetical protein
MRVRINQLGSVFAALALAAPAAYAASPSESSPTDTDSRWIPSFSFAGGALVQVMDSASAAHCQLGRPQEPVRVGQSNIFVNRLACRDPEAELVPPPVTPLLADPLCPNEPSADGRRACLRPSVDDHDVSATPFVAASLQVMTPRVPLVPSSPRFFVSGEFVTLWAQKRNIAKESNPSTLDWPLETPFPEATNVGGPTLSGVGTEVTSEVQNYTFGARAGLAFPFHFRGRRLWVKPSFGWLQYEVDVDALLVAGIKDDPVDVDPTTGSFGPGIREVTFDSGFTETFNGIGPGIELEMEAARVGPLGVSLFINADAYRILGETDFDFSDTLQCPAYDPLNPTGGCASSLVNMPAGGSPSPVPDANIGADTYTGDFEFSVDPWAYRAGVGIRFHWLGR